MCKLYLTLLNIRQCIFCSFSLSQYAIVIMCIIVWKSLLRLMNVNWTALKYASAQGVLLVIGRICNIFLIRYLRRYFWMEMHLWKQFELVLFSSSKIKLMAAIYYKWQLLRLPSDIFLLYYSLFSFPKSKINFKNGYL